MSQKILLASDHAGFQIKDALLHRLAAQGHDVLDLGTHNDASVDYPDYGQAAARAILAGEAAWGVVICGTGIGISIAANRFKGIRCALCTDVETAKLARAHNDANLLALSGRVLKPDEAMAIVAAFAETPFEGRRHQNRIIKIDA